MASHSACNRSWTGNAAHHCGGCHETFRSLQAFDAHRVVKWDDTTVCELYTAQKKLSLWKDESKGYWRLPEMDEGQIERMRQARARAERIPKVDSLERTGEFDVVKRPGRKL